MNVSFVALKWYEYGVCAKTKHKKYDNEKNIEEKKWKKSSKIF